MAVPHTDMYVCVCRLLQDHHSLQSRADCCAVCRLFHSPLPAHRRESSPYRRYSVCTSVHGILIDWQLKYHTAASIPCDVWIRSVPLWHICLCVALSLHSSWIGCQPRHTVTLVVVYRNSSSLIYFCTFSCKYSVKLSTEQQETTSGWLSCCLY